MQNLHLARREGGTKDIAIVAVQDKDFGDAPMDQRSDPIRLQPNLGITPQGNRNWLDWMNESRGTDLIRRGMRGEDIVFSRLWMAILR